MTKYAKALEYFKPDSYDVFKDSHPELADMYRRMSVVIGERQLKVVREALELADRIEKNPYSNPPIELFQSTLSPEHLAALGQMLNLE